MASLGIELSVIRHPENAYYNEIIHPKEGQHLQMGLVNAGDGSGQHPSQSMLDMMTIYNEFGRFDGLKIMIVGDLTNSRVARSNMEILNTLGAEVYFSGPEYWYDAEEFSKYGTYVKNIDDEIPELDVLMLLRVQHERHNGTEAKTEQLMPRTTTLPTALTNAATTCLRMTPSSCTRAQSTAGLNGTVTWLKHLSPATLSKCTTGSLSEWP